MSVFVSKHYRPTKAVIDLVQLARNFKILQSQVPPGAFVCPMVKADAYGHGAVRVSAKLRDLGAQELGVGLVEEGIELRENGDHGSILQFSPFEKSAAEAMFEWKLTPVVSSLSDLKTLSDVATRMQSSHSTERWPIHIKINTGMNRLGLPPTEVKPAAEYLKRHPRLVLKGVATHFSDAEDATDVTGRTQKQLQVFTECLSELRSCGQSDFAVHFANSLAMHGAMSGGIRPGIALYGGESAFVEKFKVKPVLELVSEIALVQKVKANERVSYGGHWTALRESRVGVVPCGYADGFRRGLTGASVLVMGQAVPVIGTVCMDYLMCDLTAVPLAQVGERVTLIGTQAGLTVTAEDLANRIHTISYEIFTGIGPRVPRVFVDGDHRESVVSSQ